MASGSPASAVPRKGPDRAILPDLPAMQLAEPFVEDDADGGGQVEAADPAGGHWNAQRAVAAALDEPRRQAVRLAAKEQTVAGLVGDLGVRAGGMGAQAENAGAGQGGL